jgi:hypothetical protein
MARVEQGITGPVILSGKVTWLKACSLSRQCEDHRAIKSYGGLMAGPFGPLTIE